MPSLQKLKEFHSQVPLTLMEKIIKSLNSLESYSLQEFLSGWFFTERHEKSNVHDIHTTNFDSWLAFIMFHSTLPNLSFEQLNIVRNMRQKWNLESMKDGTNTMIRHADYRLASISHIHHPLILYGMFYCYKHWGHFICLYSKGFRYMQTDSGITYWYRQGIPSKNGAPFPVLIFHGINSMGWSQYATLYEAFEDDRSIFLINNYTIHPCSLCTDIPPNSFWSFFSKVVFPRTSVNPFIAMTPDNFQRNVIQILDTHHIHKCSILGHSWGTFLASWLLKRIPERISHVTFIDPVALTIYFPDTLYTLFYKPPRTLQDYLIRYFLTYDITIAYNVQRHFEWHEAAIFLEDIPRHIGIVIGIAMNDEFICSRAAVELVDKYIEQKIDDTTTRAPVHKLVWESLGHADAIMNRKAMRDMVVAINTNEKDSKDFFERRIDQDSDCRE